MTICFVTDSFPPDIGGIATFYGNLAAMLVAEGHKVIVLKSDFYADPDEEDSIQSDGSLTTVVFKKSYKKKYRFYSRYFRPGGLEAPYWISAGLCAREWLFANTVNYSIELVEVSDYGGMGVFLSDPSLPAMVITGNGSLTQYARINHVKNDDHFRVLTALEKNAFQAADLVLPYSKLNRKDLDETFHIQSVFASAPWDSSLLMDIRTNSQGMPLVVAGLQKIKGAELMADTLVIVMEKEPGFQLEWIGMEFYTSEGGRSTSAYIEDKFPGIWNRNFLWKGATDRGSTLKQMAGCRFVVIPSLFETFSFVAVEAATLGKPVIITEGTGASYLFEHGKNAWIIPADQQSLAEAMLLLYHHPELCKKLGDNARTMISEKFDRKNVVHERIALYQRVNTSGKKSVVANNRLAFLSSYLTSGRRNYYMLRKIVKKIIKGK